MKKLEATSFILLQGIYLSSLLELQLLVVFIESKKVFNIVWFEFKTGSN